MNDKSDRLTSQPQGNGRESQRQENEVRETAILTTDVDQSPKLSFPVIGVGASAGGLEAFIEFFGAMTAAPNMTFVVIQHLPPERESMIAEILSKHTSLPVQQVEDQMPVEINQVYIIRPGRTMTIQDGRLHLGEPLEKPGHRRPVDDFFRSLAEEQRERSACVILSGMGSNGSAGAQTIKAAGGICIAQDPETAKFPSMPRHAIDTGIVDFVLPAAQIPELLSRYFGHPYMNRQTAAESILRQDRRAFHEILAVLRTRSLSDFSGYRKPTILRRIQRRMGLHQLLDLSDYVQFLRQHPTEATALADDLVIHVTGFFRDPDAWETLRQRVILPLVADREPDSSIRAWVTACSTGEEAYSLAILLKEAVEDSGKAIDIKVFATDLAGRMLVQARNGAYPGGIESEVPPERLARFFDRDDSVYRIKKEVRELVVFAPQNLLQDPPFSRLDICTCRNLLIYLEPETQRRVLSLLHFGLREGGALFLGPSETGSGVEDTFVPLDKKWRIFRRVGPTREADFPLLIHARNSEGQLSGPRSLPRPSLMHVTQRMLLEQFTPAAVVIDQQSRVVYFHGDTGPYLNQPPGEPTRELFAMAREGLRGAIRIALSDAAAKNETIRVRDGYAVTSEGRVRVVITVSPLEERFAPGHFLVSFQHAAETDKGDEKVVLDEKGDNDHLLQQLQRTRDELQSTVEELQTSNEELKASHEEVTSVNEELQSTNEELETSKEELQSLNEELATINAQLEAKMRELEASTNDMSSLLSSTDIAVIFLDTNFRVRRFTPATRDLIDLIPSDVGRPLSDLARKFTDPHLMHDAQAVLNKLVPVDRQIVGSQNRLYIRRILPYRTVDNRINGVVLTFVDVTRLRYAENAQRDSEERYRIILEQIKEFAICVMNSTGTINVWNVGAEIMFGYTPKEVLGKNISFLYTPEDRQAGEPEGDFREAADHGQTSKMRRFVRKDGRRLLRECVLSALLDETGNDSGFIAVLRENATETTTA